MKYSVSIDVPKVDDGLRFYCDALGLTEIARPVPTYAILKCGDARIGLFEKPAGSKPAPQSAEYALVFAPGITKRRTLGPLPSHEHILRYVPTSLPEMQNVLMLAGDDS